MPEYNRNALIMVLFLLQQIIKSSSTWITNSFIWSSFKVKLSMLFDLCSWRLSFSEYVTSSDRPFLLCSPATVESGCFEILSPMLLSLFFFYLSILMSIIRDSFLRKKTKQNTCIYQHAWNALLCVHIVFILQHRSLRFIS